MNIKIVDSWLREYLHTKASSLDIARTLSLSSVSVEKFENGVYDIEVTTNRADLMSVVSIAREAATVLSEDGLEARFKKPEYKDIAQESTKFPIDVKNDSSLVNRICAVVLEVSIGSSPKEISEKLEKSGIRSINNLVDVTNYVMREIGHPAHVFDFDLLTQKMIIRQSKQGEEIVTLDGKKYRLYGGDIVLDDGTGRIVDLLGIMGTQNSVVRDETKRIVFLIDNNNPNRIRNTSMSLGIRTEAAILNEKGIDPELAMEALKRGVELYKELAQGKVISQVLDIYPNKPSTNKVMVNTHNIEKLIGVPISKKNQVDILTGLGFMVKDAGDNLEVTTPTNRPDVTIEEDVVEEIARIYGYQKLPSIVPSFLTNKGYVYANNFFFEKRVKEILKNWGFVETYTYSLVSEDLFEGPTENGLKLKNPLSEDMVYLRNSLIPSLLKVVEENKARQSVKIFEIANVYIKNGKNLPNEKLMLSGVVKKNGASFYEVKGIIEALLEDLGIYGTKFRQKKEGIGAEIGIGDEKLGYIEVLDTELINFEIDFDLLLENATLKRVYKPIAKFPPIIEDITIVTKSLTEKIVDVIKAQSTLVENVTLKSTFEDSRTFQISYQRVDRNLTREEVTKERGKIIKGLEEETKALIR